MSRSPWLREAPGVSAVERDSYRPIAAPGLARPSGVGVRSVPSVEPVAIMVVHGRSIVNHPDLNGRRPAARRARGSRAAPRPHARQDVAASSHTSAEDGEPHTGHAHSAALAGNAAAHPPDSPRSGLCTRSIGLCTLRCIDRGVQEPARRNRPRENQTMRVFEGRALGPSATPPPIRPVRSDSSAWPFGDASGMRTKRKKRKKVRKALFA